MRNMLVLILLVTSLVPSSSSQTGQTPMGGPIVNRGELHTPELGSPARKAIMDALRVPVEKKLKQQVVFKTDHLRVKDGWAFLIGKPQRPDGSPVDYRETVFQNAIDSGAFDDGIVALLHEVNGKWRVVQYVIGATDVPYVDWDKKYRVPSAIFEQR